MGGFFPARGGSSLYFEDSGSGPPVLALPGVGGGAFFFDGLAKHLGFRYRVLAADLPGTGRSTSVPPDFSLESWVADLGDLVEKKFGKPAVILGHSLGTILALKLWEAKPEWIRGLIFACGLPKVRSNIRDRLIPRAEAISKNGMAGWGPKVSPGIFSAAAMHGRSEAVKNFERLFERQNPAAYVRSIRILLDADASATVPAVKIPCLAVAGMEDSYAPPEAVREFTHRIPGGCRVEVMPECSHMPFLEAPEKFAAAIGDFLKSLGG